MRPSPNAVTPAAAAPPDGGADALPPLFPLRELPGRPYMPMRNGRRFSVATLYRWIGRGTRGCPPLRTMVVGGTRCTSDQWAREFFDRLTAGPGAAAAADTPGQASRTPSARARAQRRAADELAADGI